MIKRPACVQGWLWALEELEQSLWQWYWRQRYRSYRRRVWAKGNAAIEQGVWLHNYLCNGLDCSWHGSRPYPIPQFYTKPNNQPE